ncbi:hypothetical protein ADEAN_000107300 [Angomonas deanei]|uniref:Uncharacterized protein n=1 Tax=Angomonas deanei TaxID=59799 RepID=A0A7G2C1N3_9TRYP|nr:hypothetical protein ADEAN_000107300 [Angomonas deanei]
MGCGSSKGLDPAPAVGPPATAQRSILQKGTASLDSSVKDSAPPVNFYDRHEANAFEKRRQQRLNGGAADQTGPSSVRRERKVSLYVDEDRIEPGGNSHNDNFDTLPDDATEGSVRKGGSILASSVKTQPALRSGSGLGSLSLKSAAKDGEKRSRTSPTLPRCERCTKFMRPPMNDKSCLDDSDWDGEEEEEEEEEEIQKARPTPESPFEKYGNTLPRSESCVPFPRPPPKEAYKGMDDPDWDRDYEEKKGSQKKLPTTVQSVKSKTPAVELKSKAPTTPVKPSNTLQPLEKRPAVPALPTIPVKRESAVKPLPTRPTSNNNSNNSNSAVKPDANRRNTTGTATAPASKDPSTKRPAPQTARSASLPAVTPPAPSPDRPTSSSNVNRLSDDVKNYDEWKRLTKKKRESFYQQHQQEGEGKKTILDAPESFYISVGDTKKVYV